MTTTIRTTYDIKTKEKLYTIIQNHKVILTPHITNAILYTHKCK